MTRSQVRVVLGLLWILDGALQLQPFMFGRGFAREVIAPAGDGQPAMVASSVHWAADLIASQPLVWDLAFALIQLAIGVALLIPGTARLALVGSVLWSVGVWIFGEGLGGLASGHAALLTGAPGAVLLYALIALGVWPATGDGDEQLRPAWWLPSAWAVLWVGGALLQALPGQNHIGDVVGWVQDNGDGAPIWLARLDQHAASALTTGGPTVLVALVLLQAAIGLGALAPGTPRRLAGVAGISVSVVFWVFGQSLGELWTGQATDPNAAPLVILLALAMMASAPSPQRQVARPPTDAQATSG
jgi:hypothetical protein